MSVKSYLRIALIDLDLIVFLVTFLLTGYVSLVLSRTQTMRPFHPQDGALYNNFTSDTVPISFLFLIHYFLLAPAIYVLEARLLRHTPLPPHRARLRAARLALGMLTSTMIAILLVEIGKGYVGRLRPSFATLCFGDSVPPGKRSTLPTLFSDADCPTPNRKALHDARRSFPSGHAALGVGGAAYAQLCAAYAAPRMPTKAARLIAFTGGWLLMAFGAGVAASRVVDDAHHVGDVAVGAIIGVWAAIAHFWFVVADFRAEDDMMKAGEVVTQGGKVE